MYLTWEKVKLKIIIMILTLIFYKNLNKNILKKWNFGKKSGERVYHGSILMT